MALVQNSSGHLRRSVTLGSALMLALSACSGGATPAPTAAPTATPAGSSAASAAATLSPLAQVCEKGKAEGKVVYYGSYDDTMKSMVEKFKLDHPGIEVELLAGTTDQFVAKVLTEDAAGRPPEQDVQEGSVPLFASLIEKKLIATDIDWVGLGVPKDRLSPNNLPRINRGAYGLGYNTSKTKPEDLPATYEELITDSKWLKFKGLISMDPRGRPFNTLAISWGKEKTVDFVTKMKQLFNPLIIQGETANLTSVASGEVLFSTSGRNAEILEQKAKNVPVDAKFMNIIGVVDNYNVVLAKAQHPNAARCWAGWYSSPAADPWLLEFRKRTNLTTPPNLPAGVKVVASETAESIALESDMAKVLGPILTAK